MATLMLRSAAQSYDWRYVSPTAPTLVFIHGWMLSQQYWQPLREYLGTHLGAFNCLTYDLRGFGQSAAMSEQPFDLISYAEDTIAMLDCLETAPVWLVGHSLGGSIALCAADLAPERVAGVICLNAGGGIYLKEEFDRFRALGQQLVQWRDLMRLPGFGLYFQFDSVRSRLEKQWGQQRVQDFLAAHPVAAREALLASTTETAVHDLPQVVARLQQPVHFIAGQEDAIMPPRFVHYLASFHRRYDHGASVLELARCGHLAMLEQPQVVAQHMQQILCGSL